MSEQNLSLYVAAYPDETSASEDFRDLKAAKDIDEIAVLAAAVVSRDAAGKVDVHEHDAGAGRRAVGWGAVGGLLVGLFSPALLAATAVGAAVGGALHEIVKHHEEKKLGKDLEEYLLPGSSAILAVIDDQYADRLDKVLARADKRVARAIDSGNYDKLVKALNDAGYDVEAAIES